MTCLFCLEQVGVLRQSISAFPFRQDPEHCGDCCPAFNRLMLDVVCYSQRIVCFIFHARKREDRRRERDGEESGGGCGFIPADLSRPASFYSSFSLCSAHQWSLMFCCPGWSGPARLPDDWSRSIVQVRNHHKPNIFSTKHNKNASALKMYFCMSCWVLTHFSLICSFALFSPFLISLWSFMVQEKQQHNCRNSAFALWLYCAWL